MGPSFDQVSTLVDGKMNMKAYERRIDAKRSVSVAMNFPRRRWWDTQRRTRMTGGSVATCYCSRFFPPLSYAPLPPLLNRFYEQKSGKLLRLEIDSTSPRNRRILPVSQFPSYLLIHGFTSVKNYACSIDPRIVR